MIYNKGYIFPLIPGTEFLKIPIISRVIGALGTFFILIFVFSSQSQTNSSQIPWDFIGASFVLMWLFLAGPKVASGWRFDQKDQTLTFSPNPQHLRKRVGLESELIIDHAYMMKPP